MTISEVSSLLLAHEGRIEAFNPSIDNNSPSVNMVTGHTSRKADNSRPSSPNSSRGRGRGRGRTYRGGRRLWHNNNGRVVCQICGFPGHVAEICYYCYDKDFVPRPTNSQHQSSHSAAKPSANYSAATLTAASTASVPYEWWFSDSGASHHVTNDLGNLNLSSEYSGNGKVHMGNETCMSISHIGSSNFHPKCKYLCS